jgi:hypothetical protein
VRADRAPPFYDLDRRRQFMQAAGITTQVLCAPPFLFYYWLDARAALDVIRMENDAIAGAVAQQLPHPLGAHYFSHDLSLLHSSFRLRWPRRLHRPANSSLTALRRPRFPAEVSISSAHASATRIRRAGGPPL